MYKLILGTRFNRDGFQNKFVSGGAIVVVSSVCLSVCLSTPFSSVMCSGDPWSQNVVCAI